MDLDEEYLAKRPIEDIPLPFWLTDAERTRVPTLASFLKDKDHTKANRLIYLLKVHFEYFRIRK